mmetsp:Transcript_31107/g.49819  ORF Transcript_31107/g.49819 Transcript_31107/m.49819 type:complete len:258 (+) Transcript_31107:2889-3662(+)
MLMTLVRTGCVEAAVTMPFEVIKTRQQIGAKRYPGVLGITKTMKDAIGQAGGVRGLYSGLGIAMGQTSGKVGIRFFTYRRLSQVAGENASYKAIAGCLAGATEALVWITPTERMKILRIKNPNKPLKEFAKSIAVEGPRSLWVGALPTVVRNSASVGFRFFMYEKIIGVCNHNAALGGALVGATSTVLNNPLDVVKSEMQARQGNNRFNSVRACITETIATKGLWHLFTAGLSARILKITIGQATIFWVVDCVSKYS